MHRAECPNSKNLKLTLIKSVLFSAVFSTVSFFLRILPCLFSHNPNDHSSAMTLDTYQINFTFYLTQQRTIKCSVELEMGEDGVGRHVQHEIYNLQILAFCICLAGLRLSPISSNEQWMISMPHYK